MTTVAERRHTHATVSERSDGAGPDFMGALADLTLAVGSLGQQVKNSSAPQPRVPWEACHPVGPLGAVTLSAGAGTFDQPDVMGPHDPYWWDLRKISAWGFTAGSVNFYKNSVQGEQVGFLSGPGNIVWGLSELLAPRDRIIVVASGITGFVSFVVRAIEVETGWLPEYLL